MDDRERRVRQGAGALAEVLARQVSLGRTRWTEHEVKTTLARLDELESALTVGETPRHTHVSPDALQGVANPTEVIKHDDARSNVVVSAESAAAQNPERVRPVDAPATSGARPVMPRAEESAPARDTAAVTPDVVPWAAPVPALSQPSRPDIAELARIVPGEGALVKVSDILGDCQRCGLCRTRKNIVFGAGDAKARLMFIGEGPGADEDMQGIPFVGKSGQLLTKMIGAMGLSREQVYIANVVKCRPPDNREPAPDEVAACLPFLEAQIRLVQPEVIVTLGRTALQGLTGKRGGLMSTRGQWLKYGQIDVMPTFHPSYLLREESAKAAAWADLQLVMKRLGLQRPR